VVQVLVLAVLLVLVLREQVAVPVRVTSSSMLPTLAAGDVVLLRHGVAPGEVGRGDVVRFSSPTGSGPALKRVVGVAGDSVVVLDSVLHLDGVPVPEPYVDHAAIDGYYSRTFEVPAGTVFVLGDNRGNSEDSRDYGPVRLDALDGEVVLRLWPLVRIGGARPSPPKP
jgi:signal peptidase I